MKHFSQNTIEYLRYYVYILVDPRNNKIFYVGKGKGNRVFAHLNDALESPLATDKLDIIREIINTGKEVEHFIVRHDLDEDDAYTVESVLIDFLTYTNFSSVANISNIAAGHHQWFKGIKTVQELEQLYASTPLKEEDVQHNIMTININKTYNIKSDFHPDIYESTRKSWVLSERRIKEVDFVMSEYRGIIRAIFKPTKWLKSGNRWMFEGIEVTDKTITDLYLNKAVPAKKKGMANPIRYFSKTN
jgi:uncharacterized protein